MNDVSMATRAQLSRQINHWTIAVTRLQKLDDLASPEAWNNLERYLGLSIRQHLTQVTKGLVLQIRLLQASLEAASTLGDLEQVRRQLVEFRRKYVRVETTVDFYTDAINTRTNPTVAGYLKACDSMAHRSMAQILDQLGKPTPVVLTYVDKGMGASILKAGLRLWDGASISPVAAIKIVRHNLTRPTSLIHETGHQVAHVTGWNEELARELEKELRDTPPGVADIWSSWASEIAADAFAFVHTGYASVAALHDVVAGDESQVMRYIPGDPHPISYIRVLLGVEMCRQFYGPGPWDDLAIAWTQRFPLDKAKSGTESILRASVPRLPRVVAVSIGKPMKCFGNRPLKALIDPGRVSPKSLDSLEKRLGTALYTSMHWIWTESLRLLALTGLRAATMVKLEPELLKQQTNWMLRLGGAIQAV
jgi:hypothetical protein